MTDTFLDAEHTDQLTRNLHTIAVNAGELGRISRRETSPPGGRAARPPSGYSSRPPMNLGALDIATDALHALQGWTRCLHEDAHVPTPERTDLAALANHLGRHAHRIAQQEWAHDCATEIDDHTRWISSVTGVDDITHTPSLDDHDTRARAASFIGSAREVADLIGLLGDPPPHPKTIRSWGDRGHIDVVEWGDGKPRYKLYEVRLMVRGIYPKALDLPAS